MLGIDAAVNQACAVISPHQQVDSEYLLEHLKMSYDRLRSMARGGNQANLTLGLVADLDVIVPDLSTQRAFAKVSRRVGELADAGTTRARLLDELFASLQRRAFTGEL